METLNTGEIKEALKGVPEWSKSKGGITRTYQFKDFLGSVKFVNAVAKKAEKAQHHPDIDIRWNKVRLFLTTHDAGGITAKDFKLAQESDAIASKI